MNRFPWNSVADRGAESRSAGEFAKERTHVYLPSISGARECKLCLRPKDHPIHSLAVRGQIGGAQ